MLQRNLSDRAVAYNEWRSQVKNLLDAPLDCRPSRKRKRYRTGFSFKDLSVEISDFQRLIAVAKEQKLRCSELIVEMKEAISEAERCAAAITKVLRKKKRPLSGRHQCVVFHTYTSALGSILFFFRRRKPERLVTVGELVEFVDQLDNLACSISEGQLIKVLFLSILPLLFSDFFIVSGSTKQFGCVQEAGRQGLMSP